MNQIRALFLGPENPPDQLVWIQRRQTWAGDVTANRIRLVALVIFAINEVVNYSVLHVVDQRFHVGSLLLVGLWFVSALVFSWMLRNHVLPRHAPYIMAAVDLLWMTWLLFLADGPKSPLVSIYFLIIGLSGMRLNPRLSLFSGGAAVFGYLSVLEFVKLRAPQFMIPRFHETIMVLCLLLMGIVMAHIASRTLILLGERK